MEGVTVGCDTGRGLAGRFWIRVLALLLVLMWLQAAASERVLQRGLPAEPASIDPHFARDVYEMTIVQDLFAGLMMLGQDGTPVPGLAREWTVSDDGTSYRFRLREGLRWSDGVPLTADDFVYSFRRLFDPATASPVAYLLYLFENAQEVNSGRLPVDRLGVHASGPEWLEIRITEPAPFLPSLLAHTSAVPVPKHVVERHRRAWTRAESFVGNGAFLLADWRINDRLVLRRNPEYFAAADVPLPGVTYNIVPDPETALNRFRAGELDVMRGVPAGKMDWVRREMPDSLRVAPQLAVFYLVLNLARPGLSDQRVRNALSMVIERELIGDKVMRFENPPAYSFVPHYVAGRAAGFASENQSMSPGDRKRQARALLAEAGFGPENPLELTIQYSSARGEKRVPMVIGSLWREIGVRVRYSMMEFRVLMDQLQTGSFDVVPTGWLADYDDPSAFLLMLDSGSTANYGKYANDHYDRLLDAAAQERDPGRRSVILLEAERILINDQPVIPLSFYVSANLVNRAVSGWRENSLNFNPSQYLGWHRTGSLP
jgi:oligopeptide transport system substrate-binding protein